HTRSTRDWSSDVWSSDLFFLYMMRRVACPTCGVRVEQVPWVEGKHQLTTTYMWFLARWAKRLSWKDVATVFHTSWDQVFRSVTKLAQASWRERRGETARR